MEEGTFRRYPIGIQDFEDLRNNNYIYVDKTALIYQLVNTNKIYFLVVPVVSERACSSLRSKPIFWERKNFSTDLTWSS